jgi:hypothetical protein
MTFQELDHNDLRWCLLRAPKEVLVLMKKHPNDLMCAGGFIRGCIANEPLNDIDLFASTPELAKSYAQEFTGGKAFYTTPNAYSVTKGVKLMTQFIHRWSYKEPAALLESFDFTIAQACFWWDVSGAGGSWQSRCSERFYTDLAAKRLVYTAPQRNEDAGGSMLRVLKFYQRGYRIPLDSLGAVIARLCSGVHDDVLRINTDEAHLAKILTGLLREVDPNVDPGHIAHLPSMTKDDEARDDSLEVESAVPNE